MQGVCPLSLLAAGRPFVPRHMAPAAAVNRLSPGGARVPLSRAALLLQARRSKAMSCSPAWNVTVWTPQAALHVMVCKWYKLEYEDSGSDLCDEIYAGKGGPGATTDRAAAGERLDLSEIFFSNEEYYSKLEELKKAHLRTMAELENMYRRKLQLKAMETLDPTLLETPGHRPPRWDSSPAAPRRLRKSHSAVELRRASGRSDSSSSGEEEDAAAINNAGSGLIFSPKEHIKNMWRDFNLSPHNRHLLSSSVRSLPLGTDQGSPRGGAGRRRPPRGGPGHGPTVPKPFQMTQRQAERRERGTEARAAMERENAELRRQLEELTECQRKFRAGPVPAHVHLPLYDELRGRGEERRRARELEGRRPGAAQKPFSFLERERLKKEQRQLQPPQPSGEEKVKPFRAKPVPRAVYAAASGEQMKEEQLYRSIKIQMRAQEMLHSAAMPPSMLARRLSDRKKPDVGGG
uniref:Protein FAM161A n=1 Tax=Gasterosteus aculeatus aculeatus TaxID=481459 RepID=A0AAQ4PJJ6_GASAC